MWLAIAATVIKAALGSLWSRFFPDKTATDQKVSDLTVALKQDQHAREIADKVSDESLSDVESDLDKRVRDPNG